MSSTDMSPMTKTVCLNFRQIPEVKECRAPVIEALKVCLSDDADNDLDILDATIDAALDFLCYKGGERIASKAYFMRTPSCLLTSLSSIYVGEWH